MSTFALIGFVVSVILGISYILAGFAFVSLRLSFKSKEAIPFSIICFIIGVIMLYFTITNSPIGLVIK